MKRRRAVIALGLCLLIGLAWWAKATASWPPVALGKVANTGLDEINLWACDEGALVEYDANSYRFFDAGRGIITSYPYDGYMTRGVAGSFRWQLVYEKEHKRDVLTLTGAQGEKHTYILPHQTLDWVRAFPERNRLVVLGELPFYQAGLFEFDLNGGKLIHQWKRDMADTSPPALSRDGETVTDFSHPMFRLSNAHTGQVRQKIPLRSDSVDSGPTFSLYGKYAIYGHVISYSSPSPLSTAMTPSYIFRVVDVAMGRVLWSQATDESWALSEDERMIVMHVGSSWQVRELSTGQVLRHLPYISGTTVTALSPNGNTLYSVANGVLYRQRVA